jgi:hypothetical protein
VEEPAAAQAASTATGTRTRRGAGQEVPGQRPFEYKEREPVARCDGGGDIDESYEASRAVDTSGALSGGRRGLRAVLSQVSAPGAGDAGCPEGPEAA